MSNPHHRESDAPDTGIAIAPDSRRLQRGQDRTPQPVIQAFGYSAFEQVCPAGIVGIIRRQGPDCVVVEKDNHGIGAKRVLTSK
ncbi:MAG: hypothetical protein ACRERV_18215 [Methylococcales bacterium]